MTVTALHNQSLFDIAIQHTGNVENAFKIAVANELSMTDDLVSGMQILIPDTVIVNAELRDYFTAKKIKPATAMSDDDRTLCNNAQKGIGYMQIGRTFKVS